jgi:hypothetical protein
MNVRRTAIVCLLASTATVAFGCVGASSSGGGGGGGTGSNDESACDAYFDAYVASYACQLPLPAAEIARQRPLFDVDCNALIALPGAGPVKAALVACAAAFHATPCAVSTPEACNAFFGSLDTGASCVDGAQCSSGECTFSSSGGADGGTTTESSCGTCAAAIPVGGACGGTAAGGCAPGSECMALTTASTCATITYGAAGAACGGAALCQPNLFCDSTTHTCAVPGGEGSACDSYLDCAAPFVCGGSNTCALGGASGATCAAPSDCGRGLGCDVRSMTCVALAWANAGEACSAAAPCLVGFCPLDGESPTAVCPTVVANGEPCPTDDTSTCDTFADCIDGTCAPEDSAVCN